MCMKNASYRRNEFITYGHFLVKNKFKEITDNNLIIHINKPNGGVWSSPTISEWGWIDWCQAEEFRLDTFNIYTKWRLRNPDKILVIDSYGDLEKAMDKYGVNTVKPLSKDAIARLKLHGYSDADINRFNNRAEYRLDFWKIKMDGYDGVMLTAKGNWECHLPIGKRYKERSLIDLNSWDCESMVVWNWNQIKIIEKGRIF